MERNYEGFHGRPGNDYTFEYGFGSLRSCAWCGGSCGSKDAGDGCGCGDCAEPFGEYENEYGDGFVTGRSGGDSGGYD
jgi:hypothetical protein